MFHEKIILCQNPGEAKLEYFRIKQKFTRDKESTDGIQSDQMLELLSCQNVFKSCRNNIHCSFTLTYRLQNSPTGNNIFGLLLRANSLPITLKIFQCGHTDGIGIGGGEFYSKSRLYKY